MKGELRRRLREIQKRAGTGKKRELKVHLLLGSDFVPRGVNRKPLLKKGEHESSLFVVHVVDPKEEDVVRFDYRGGPRDQAGPVMDSEEELRREIAELEARKRELRAKRKRQ